MNIWSGTLTVSDGSTHVVVASGDALSDFNCSSGSLVVIAGAVYFVEARDETNPTTEFELTRAYDGGTSAEVVESAEIWPVSERNTNLVTLAQVVARVTSQLDIYDKNSAGLFFELRSPTTGDPATGKLAFDTAVLTPGEPDEATMLVVSDTDGNGLSVSSLVETWAAGTTLVVRSLNSAAYVAVEVLAAVTAEGGYHSANVSIVGNGGSLSEGEPLAVSWFRVGAGLAVNATGFFADRYQYDGEDTGFVFLSADGDGTENSPAALYRLEIAGSPAVWGPAIAFEGPRGYTGWAPRLALVNDGTRRVLQVAGYVGGEGTAPTEGVGKYISGGGLVDNVADGMNVRGDTGAKGESIGYQGAFSTSTPDTDPGNGIWRLNNADPTLATFAYIDNVDSGGNSLVARLTKFNSVSNANARGYLRWQSSSAATSALEMAVTGDVVFASGYMKVPVSYISGSIFADATTTALTITENATNGDDGDDGDDGLDGTDPGSWFVWDADTSASDQGSGRIWADDADLEAAEWLYVSKTNRAGNDLATWLLGLDSSSSTIKGSITLSREGMNAQWSCDIIGVDDNTGFVEIEINAGSQTEDPAFLANDAISLQFARAGDKGTDGGGAGDVVGPASATANDYVLMDGTTGKLIKDSGHTYGRYADKASNGSDFSDKHAAFDNFAIKGANVASNTTVDLDAATGSLIVITGTTTTTAFTLTSGRRRRLVANAAWPITASANVVINGIASSSTYACTAGDIIDVWQDGTTSRLTIHPISGMPVAASTDAKTLLGHTFSQIRADLDLEAGTDFPSYAQAPRYNHAIDGRFDFWTVSTSITSSGYGAADMWRLNEGSGAACTFSRQSFTIGQTDVPGNPKYFARLDRATTGSAASSIKQRIADVTRLAGGSANLQLWVKGSTSFTATLGLNQNFGTGGSPSSQVDLSTNISVTSSWQKFNHVFTLGSVSGKTLGSTADTDYLEIDIGLPTAAGTVSLDIALVDLSENPTLQPFVYDRPLEMSRVANYFERRGDASVDAILGGGFIESSSTYSASMAYARKRSTPSVTLSGTIAGDKDGTNMTGMSATFSSVSPDSCKINATGGSGGTAGQGLVAYLVAGSNFVSIDSRL